MVEIVVRHGLEERIVGCEPLVCGSRRGGSSPIVGTVGDRLLTATEYGAVLLAAFIGRMLAPSRPAVPSAIRRRSTRCLRRRGPNRARPGSRTPRPCLPIVRRPRYLSSCCGVSWSIRKRGDGHANRGLAVGHLPQAQPAQDAMFPPAEGLQHRSGVLPIGRLAENLALALGHGVAAEDQSPADPPRHVGRLLIGQPGDKLRGRLAAAHAALGRFGRRLHLERVSGRRQQFAPPRRPAGQDQFRIVCPWNSSDRATVSGKLVVVRH